MQFAVRAVRFCRTLPLSWEARRIGGQLIDASTSMAMNYRAAGRARSHREFTAKLGTVVEDADESLGWLELMTQLQMANGGEQRWLLQRGGRVGRDFWQQLSHGSGKAEESAIA
jgi:four helix bundle protein